jgi:hypothetical protein
MNKLNNGRINLQDKDNDLINKKFQLFDNIPNKSNTYYDAVKGVFYDTPLSNLYFSTDNQQIIQNAIRKGVYEKSNNTLIIDEQDYDALKNIMRSTFLEHCKHLKNNITDQISELNNIVIKYCIPKVYDEAIGYMNYKKDISTMPIPIQHPKQERADFKELEFKTWF